MLHLAHLSGTSLYCVWEMKSTNNETRRPFWRRKSQQLGLVLLLIRYYLPRAMAAFLNSVTPQLTIYVNLREGELVDATVKFLLSRNLSS